MKKLLAVCAAILLTLGIGSAFADPPGGPTGPTTVVGTMGDDKLVGGHGPDILIGKAGDDRLWGGRGPDVFRCGPGFDRAHNLRDTGHDVFRHCEVIIAK